MKLMNKIVLSLIIFNLLLGLSSCGSSGQLYLPSNEKAKINPLLTQKSDSTNITYSNEDKDEFNRN